MCRNDSILGNAALETGLVTTHPPAGGSALIEVGEAVWAWMAAFARVSGDAPCFARAIALVVFTSGGGDN